MRVSKYSHNPTFRWDKRLGIVANNFEWFPHFSVCHRLLDEQHQWLFKLCKKATDCALGTLDEEDFHEVLNDLAEYSRKHMVAEEAILKKCHYPMLDEHVNEHHEFLEQITGLVEKSMFGGVNKADVADFAWEWWRHHVLVTDQKFKGAILAVANQF